MKGHKMHKAKGGKVEESMDEGTKEERGEIESKKSAFKRGGMKKKHGGKVEGKKASMRADKRARGGACKSKGGTVKAAAGMSASSPLSGAGKTAEPKKVVLDREDD